MQRSALLALPLVFVLAAGCSSSGSSKTTTVDGSSVASPGGEASTASDGSGGSGGNIDGSLCALASADDLAALFPGGTIGQADPSGGQQSCSLPVAGTAGTAYFLMTPSLLPYDDRLQNDTALGFTINQLDGIGDRAYYSPGNATYPQADLVFERGGVAYSLRATYTNSGLTMAAEPGLQDTMMRIAVAWAAQLAG